MYITPMSASNLVRQSCNMRNCYFQPCRRQLLSRARYSRYRKPRGMFLKSFVWTYQLAFFE